MTSFLAKNLSPNYWKFTENLLCNNSQIVVVKSKKQFWVIEFVCKLFWVFELKFCDIKFMFGCSLLMWNITWNAVIFRD